MVDDQLITLTDPRSPVAEAYRTLRTNIEFSSIDLPLRTLLVTSSGPGEAKSVTLANLAVAMADGDQQVILVDADLRRPDLHHLFSLKNDEGFSTMFREEAAFDQPPLQPVPGTSLKVLTSGPLPPIPSHILNSKKIDAVLNKLTEMADVVLFDAPPLVAVSDASLLASKVDGVLLVVRAGTTKREYVKEAQSRLEKVNARLIGSVLANAPVDAGLQRYYNGQ